MDRGLGAGRTGGRAPGRSSENMRENQRVRSRTFSRTSATLKLDECSPAFSIRPAHPRHPHHRHDHLDPTAPGHTCTRIHTSMQVISINSIHLRLLARGERACSRRRREEQTDALSSTP
ncbi:hypothetical protein FQA47_022516 [Oryzias melastigma]|uniref:Uncharacterized protein n=1 Tax=Oryzias melastigma TaxID=30732 RepID=A0A834F9P1_ORYME|nr:hypothetical protein FQA47_022516 [Oryzias melastigma]